MKQRGKNNWSPIPEGVCFNYNGRLTKNKTRLFEQANRAMYSLLRKISCLQLEIDIIIIIIIINIFIQENILIQIK